MALLKPPRFRSCNSYHGSHLPEEREQHSGTGDTARGSLHSPSRVTSLGPSSHGGKRNLSCRARTAPAEHGSDMRNTHLSASPWHSSLPPGVWAELQANLQILEDFTPHCKALQTRTLPAHRELLMPTPPMSRSSPLSWKNFIFQTRPAAPHPRPPPAPGDSSPVPPDAQPLGTPPGGAGGPGRSPRHQSGTRRGAEPGRRGGRGSGGGRVRAG